MKIIMLTDLHGRIRDLHKFGTILEEADLVLLAGDNTHFGHVSEMQGVIEAVRKFNASVLAVSGNCDYPDTEIYLGECGAGINCRCVASGDLFFAGLSGSLPCPGRTPHEYTEEEYEVYLDALENDLKKPFILVSHQPPYGTANDCVSPWQHVGSKAVRHFIEKHSPLVCFTGHIHEGRAIDTIFATSVVNPGPARDGNYAFLRVENGEIRDLGIDRLTI